MLNLHNDPDLAPADIEFATWIDAAVRPVTLARFESETPSEYPIELDPLAVVLPPADTHARRASRGRRAAVLLAVAAAIGTAVVIARPKTDDNVTALYAAPPFPNEPAMYLPQDLPDGMKIVSVERPPKYPDGPEFFFGRLKKGKVEDFMSIAVAPNLTEADFGPVATDRFVVEGKTFFETRHPVGSASLLTTLGACGPINMFSLRGTSAQLAERSKLVKCEDGKPVPTGELGFSLLYIKTQPVEDILKHFASIQVDTGHGMVNVNVRRFQPDPPEFQDLYAAAEQPEAFETATTVYVLGSLGAIVPTETATGIRHFDLTLVPKTDPTAVISIDGPTEADVVAVAKSMQNVDRQTWQNAWQTAK